MGQDVAADFAEEIAKAKVFGSSDNIRHGKYKFLIKRIFAELVETDKGNHKMAFWELTPLASEPNPQIEGDHVDYPGAAGPLRDDGLHPNAVGSNCALKVDKDGAGARSAGANLKAPILALFNKRDGEISEAEINSTWIDLSRQKDLRVGDAIGIDPATSQPILAQKAKIANPACGMVIGCSTRVGKKRTANEKGAYVTKLVWHCVAPIGTGENSAELVAKRRQEILAAVADDGEEEVAGVAAPPPVAPVNGGGSPYALPQQPVAPVVAPVVAAPPPPPVVAPPPPPMVAKPWLIGWEPHPQAPGYFYNKVNPALGCFTEAQLAASK